MAALIGVIGNGQGNIPTRVRPFWAYVANQIRTRIVGEVAEVFLLVQEHFRVVQSDAGPRHAVKLADGSEAYVESRSGIHCQYFLSCRRIDTLVLDRKLTLVHPMRLQFGGILTDWSRDAVRYTIIWASTGIRNAR